MIVDCAIYRKGVREDVDGDISDALATAKSESGCFLWIGLHEPTADEFDVVKTELQLHPLAIEDAAKGHQRPKLEHYGDTIFVVLKTASYSHPPTEVTLGEIMLFVGDDFVITVRHGKANPLGPVRKRLEADPDLLEAGTSAVLYAVCDEVVDTYDRVSHELESDIIDLERRIFSGARDDVTEDVYKLKREILEFRTAEDPLIPVLQEIVKGRVVLCARTGEQFRNVLDHLLRMDQSIDAHNELVTNVLTAHLALLGKQQNEDVRKISAYAAMIAVPTMFAGFWGMNFEHMPELKWPVGYPMALLVMAISVVAVYRMFKKSGWL